MQDETLRLDCETWKVLLKELGPSLGLWRAAEVAILRSVAIERPLLDLGCGDGLVSSLIWNRVDIGVDPWPDVLADAARRGIYSRLEGQNLDRAHIRANSIGTVVSNSVLEHLDNVEKVLMDVHRVLKPGGRFVFTVPSDLFSGALLVPVSRYQSWRNRKLIHRNLWDPVKWEQKLRRGGFDLVTSRPYIPRSWVRLWDALDLAEQVWVRNTRIVGYFWKKLLRKKRLERLARVASKLDFSVGKKMGGGLLISAQKRDELK